MLNTITYHLSRKVPMRFAEAIEKVTEELKKEGFGIITFIDLKETLKNKIGEDFRNYVVLGACNPRYAYKALVADDKIGVFLPCSVVVQEHTNGETEVSIINPEELLHSVQEPALRTFATEIKVAMQNVLKSLSHRDINDRRASVEILM
jgi:uncharacterized protein (DUF302 family)